MSSNRSRIASRWAAGADHSTSRGAADLVRTRAFGDDAKLMRSLEARANEIRRFRPPRSQRSSAARILRGTAEDRRSLRLRRLLCLSYRRASRDAAGPCRLAQRLPRRRRAAHAAPALRSAGLYPSAPPSAAGGGGDLHARPAQRGTLRARRRPRHLADRNRLLRDQPRQPTEDVSRGAADPAPGADRADAYVSRRILSLCR